MSADDRSKFGPLMDALTEADLNETWYEKTGWSNEARSRIIILAGKKEPGFAKLLSVIIATGLMEDSLPPPIREYLAFKFMLMIPNEDTASDFFKRKASISLTIIGETRRKRM